MSTKPAQWPPRDAEGRLVWPPDPHERAQLARKLFGRALVETMDCYVDYAVDMVTNPRPARPFEIENWVSGVDRAYRRCFSSMSDGPKQIVLHLVRRVANGVLLSALTSLDQFLWADVKIELVGKGPDGQPVEVPVTSIETELAELFVACTEEFSGHSAQLTDDLGLPPQYDDL